MLLTSCSSSALPLDFIQSSCPRDLARLAPRPLGHPPLITPWLNAKPTFHDALFVLLSSIPEDLVARCDALDRRCLARPLVFNLAVLHAALHVRAATAGSPLVRPPHIADFVSLLSLIVALCSEPLLPPSSIAHLTDTLRTYLCGVYGKCCPPEPLHSLLESCCRAACLGGDARGVVVVEVAEGIEVTVVVPSPDIPVSSYAEYAVGLRSHDQDR